MEALLAIAYLCNIAGCGLFCSVEERQLECQKKYISCYEAKLADVPAPDDQDPKVWFGRLKDCVKERELE